VKLIRTLKNGYRYDSKIFYCWLLVIVGLILYVFSVNDWDFSLNPYLECKDFLCENPFYDNKTMPRCDAELRILWLIPLYNTGDCRKDCDWCYNKFLSKGVYGEKPKAEWLNNNLWLITTVLLVGAFLLNHFIYNKGKKFDLEIVFTKNKTVSIREALRKMGEDKKDV